MPSAGLCNESLRSVLRRDELLKLAWRERVLESFVGDVSAAYDRSGEDEPVLHSSPLYCVHPLTSEA